jgi:preprotein translocase subunit YajC
MKKVLTFLAAATLAGVPLFAQDAAPAAAREGGGLMQTVMMIAIALVFFYFILWRPEQKRRKAMDKQRSSLKKGDRVTAMGILGSVVSVQENTVILKMYDGAKIEILKAAITDVQAADEKAEKPVEISETH